MTQSIKRAIARLLTVLLGIVVLLLSPVGVPVAGLIAKWLLPGQLHYEQLSGSFMRGVRVSNLQYQSKTLSVKAKQAAISWHAWTLLFNQFTVHRLSADTVRIQSHQTQSTDTSGFQWPLNMTVERANLKNILMKDAHNKVQLDIQSLSFRGRVRAQSVKVKLNLILRKPHPLTLSARAQGNFSHYTLAYHLKGQNMDLAGKGEGDRNRLTLKSFSGAMLGGTISGDVTLQFAPTMAWTVNASGSRVNLNQLHDNLPKNVSFSLDTTGQRTDQAMQFKFATTITGPALSVQAKGQYNKTWQLQWNARIDKLSHFLPYLYGTLNSHGTLSGALTHPSSTGSFDLKNFSYDTYSAKTLTGQWQLNMQTHQPSNWTLTGTQLLINQNAVKKLSLTGAGTHAHHTLNTQWTTDKTQANFSVSGQYTQPNWQGILKTGKVTSKQYGTWLLQNPVTLRASPTTASVQRTCLNQTPQHGQFCVEGNWTKQKEWQIAVTAKRIRERLFGFLLPPSVKMRGRVNLIASARGTPSRITQANLNLTFSKGRFSFWAENRLFQSTYDGGFIKANTQSGKLSAQVKLNLPGKNYLSGNIVLPKFASYTDSMLQQPLSGNLVFEWHNLRAITAIITDDLLPSGQFDGNIRLNGTLAKPRMHGTIRLKNGTLRVPNHGIDFKKIGVNIQGSGKTIQFKVQGTSAGKTLTGKGEITLKNNFPITATLQGKNVLMVNTPEYTIYASPNLSLRSSGHNVFLTGSVDIPQAIFQPTNISNTVELPTEDIEYIGSRNGQRKKHWKISTDLVITFGKQVKINTQGLTGRIEGKLDVDSKPQYPMHAVGRISLYNGRYSAYGAHLDIQSGSSIYYTKGQEISNPKLDIQASKKIRTLNKFTGQSFDATQLTVGLRATGTAREPNIVFFSTPVTLSQADIMSYLVFGTASNTNTAGNFTLLLDAINILSARQGQVPSPGVTTQIQQSLGLSEFGIETEASLDALGNPVATQGRSFVVGRYILPSLYLRYSYSLQNQTNVFQLRYLLGHNWAIQGESSLAGTNTFDGFDILYTIERGTPMMTLEKPRQPAKPAKVKNEQKARKEQVDLPTPTH